jgi:hypothetical protein
MSARWLSMSSMSSNCDAGDDHASQTACGEELQDHDHSPFQVRAPRGPTPCDEWRNAIGFGYFAN